MDVLELYRSCGAYLEGHYLLASGRHSPKFLQSLKVMQHPEHADALGTALAEQFEGISVDFVIGPAMGGVVLSHTVARALGARALFAEKDGRGEMEVRSAFGVAAGERFLAVEDVVTTGASLSKAVAAAERQGATCVGLGAIIERGEAALPPGLEVRSLLMLEYPSYPAGDCPLCAEAVPLEEV